MRADSYFSGSENARTWNGSRVLGSAVKECKRQFVRVHKYLGSD